MVPHKKWESWSPIFTRLKVPQLATLPDTSALDTMPTRRDGDEGLPMRGDTELSWWMMLCVWLGFTASLDLSGTIPVTLHTKGRELTEN